MNGLHMWPLTEESATSSEAGGGRWTTEGSSVLNHSIHMTEREMESISDLYRKNKRETVIELSGKDIGYE